MLFIASVGTVIAGVFAVIATTSIQPSSIMEDQKMERSDIPHIDLVRLASSIVVLFWYGFTNLD